MPSLSRKFLRDLWLIRGQALAIGLVVAAGVGTFTMSLSTLASLEFSQSAYYERSKFAHVFAHVERAPLALADQIAAIPGIAAVDPRIVVGVTLDVEGLPEPATGIITSIDHHRRSGLNELHLRRGRFPEPGVEGEVLVSEGFARVHRLEPGRRVRAVLNGRMKELRVVGVALSPEYVYQFREGDILPDDRRFGVFWMGRPELAAVFDLEGAFNNVACLLSPDAAEPEVLRRLDLLTERYGGRGAFGRADQPSHKFVTNELNELRGMALVTPTIFLGVMAFLMHIVMVRLVSTQREQIALLKAFGYSSWRIGVHYAAFAMVIVLVGVFVGTLLGRRLGLGLTGIYTNFFHFPVLHYELEPRIAITAGVVSIAASLAGAIHAVWRAASLPAAEAMRPLAPATYRPMMIENWGLKRYFSPALRMIIRRIERNWFRTAVTCMGIAMAVAVLVLGSFIIDAVEYALESQFEVAQRHDLHVTLVDPAAASILYEIRRLPGVRYVEGFRSAPAQLRHQHHERRLNVLGLATDQVLNRLMNVDRKLIPLPSNGIVLSAKLAEVLGVAVGQSIAVEFLDGERRIVDVPVAGLIDDFAGTAAYMCREELSRMLGEGDVVNGAFVSADKHRIDELYRALKETPRIASVVIKGATMQSFRETVAENILRVRLYNSLFAAALAIGVIYNSVRISLAEQSYDLAALRILGLTRSETSLIVLGELLLLVAIAIPLGLAVGYGLSSLVIRISYDTELFRIPLKIERSTYAYAAGITALAVGISSLIVREMIDRLDIVSVLKHRG